MRSVWEVAVPANENRYLVFFSDLDQTTAAALASRSLFDPTSVSLFDGLSAEQRSRILNWDVAAPTISAVSPDSGSMVGGYSVSIHGQNLDGVTSVRFGSKLAPVTARSATELTVTALATGSHGVLPVTLTSAYGDASADFTYTRSPRSMGKISRSLPEFGLKVVNSRNAKTGQGQPLRAVLPGGHLQVRPVAA
ncbi:MAG: IPT/TIG domain-containing protein [Actinomycetes bacterium]